MLCAILGLSPDARARFIANWQAYFAEIDDPEEPARLTEEAAAIVEGRSAHTSPRPEPKLPPLPDEASQNMCLAIDEDMQWMPIEVQKTLIELAAQWDSPPLARADPAGRLHVIVDRMFDWYNANCNQSASTK